MHQPKRLNSNESYGKLEYSGKLGDYQLRGSRSGGKRYMRYERDPYSDYQNFLYKRALYGLSAYDEDELRAMHWKKRKKVQHVHNKAQNVLNIWKQQIVNHLSIKVLTTLFPRCEYIKFLVEDTGTDPSFKNNLSFKELGINKEQIIDKLIETRILPPTFRSVKTAPSKET